MPRSRALQPFKEAALALFAMGSPPHDVAKKFEAYVSHAAVYTWFNKWAELKGIDRASQMTRSDAGKKKKTIKPPKLQYPPELM